MIAEDQHHYGMETNSYSLMALMATTFKETNPRASAKAWKSTWNVGN